MISNKAKMSKVHIMLIVLHYNEWPAAADGWSISVL